VAKALTKIRAHSPAKEDSVAPSAIAKHSKSGTDWKASSYSSGALPALDSQNVEAQQTTRDISKVRGSELTAD